MDTFIQNDGLTQGQIIGGYCNKYEQNFYTYPETCLLSLHLTQEATPNPYGCRGPNTTLLAFLVGNRGSVQAYISCVGLLVVVDGETRPVNFEISRRIFPTNHNLKEESPLQPGEGRTYLVHAPRLSAQLHTCGENIVLQEAYVEDEVGNKYSEAISDDLTRWLLNFPQARKYPYSLF